MCLLFLHVVFVMAVVFVFRVGFVFPAMIVVVAVMAVLQRTVDVRDATVEVFVGLANHPPSNQHPDVPEKDRQGV